jgi:ParB family chromosome partitioning protein
MSESKLAKPLVKPAPLGRGLSALFGDADASYQPKPIAAKAQALVAVAPSAVPDRGSRMMPLAWLQPGAYQPRRHFDEEAIKGLSESIRERGILEPLLVRPISGHKDAYEIVAGERRWRASQLVGLHEVPVVVREITDREALEFGLIENVQRQDLSPLEEAEAYQRLIDDFTYPLDDLAKVVGKSRPHISNMLRLLTLPAAVRQMIAEGSITPGHAKTLVTAKDPLALAKQIVAKSLNVRQAENLARAASGKTGVAKKGPQKNAASKEDEDVVALERELGRVIGLKVKIETQGKAGSLTLFYQDFDQLDEIIRKLRG